MVNLTLLKRFSNYFNRREKKYNTIVEYKENSDDWETFQNINFNPNDEVNTEHIINWEHAWNPDYLIITYPGELEVQSRWFITDTIRTRGKQYKLVLKRDVIADNYNFIKDAPIYVEKAIINDANNPLLYNHEGLAVNQIKTKEIELRDDSKCAWLIGYIDKKYTQEKPLSWAVDVNVSKDYIDIADLPSYIRNGNTVRPKTSYKLSLPSLIQGVPINPVPLLTINIDDWTGYSYKYESYNKTCNAFFRISNKQEFLRELAHKNIYYPEITNILIENSYLTDTDTNTIKSYDGKIVKDGEKFYKIRMRKYNSTPATGTFLNGYTSDLILKIFQKKEPYTNGKLTGSVDHSILVQSERYDITFSEVSSLSGSMLLPISSTRRRTIDSAYDIFYIPYNKLKANAAWTKELALNTITQIATQLGANCYDIQLLPYAPSIEFVNKLTSTEDVLELNLTSAVDTVDYNWLTYNGQNICPVFWSGVSQRTFNIKAPEETFLANPGDVFQRKIANECDIARISEGNYQGSFEMIPIRNNGISYFNIDMTLMPISPYIHVNPDFKGLYGQDFNDMRGLICKGDYSLPRIDNAWISYQNNNKNYQNIFDREIDNMDIMHNYDRGTAITSSVLGAASSGIGMGLISGNPLLGATAGIGSGIGGLADTLIGEEKYKEGKSFKTDMFNMSLGNIKAIPQTLTKSNPLTFNNKIFPILEYYTCTDEEKNALLQKLKYNGMTIGKIGNIIDYNNDDSFFKGQLIRSISISDDTHILNAIYDELDKGIYLTRSLGE